MNILILTPDRVGSTLLQRVTTVYANMNEPADKLTINLHELTNGIVSYKNEKFNRTVLGKKHDKWGYWQSLEQVVDCLSTHDHDKISRLAHYHIKSRGDSLSDQLSFYQYLNDNFFIIACRRQNVFEHALSWGIVAESKRLNVYSHAEKFDVMKDIHTNGINIHPDAFNRSLQQYQDYIEWVDRHFLVNAYYEYERDLPNLENFILGLNPFKGIQSPLRWEDKFDISWEDWNRMHYLLSLVPFDYLFTDEEKEFMKTNIDLYSSCRVFIQDLVEDGIMVSGIPIKLHTLNEKAKIVGNVTQCLENYNKWVRLAPPSVPAVTYSPTILEETSQMEQLSWHKTVDQTNASLFGNTLPDFKLLKSDLQQLPYKFKPNNS